MASERQTGEPRKGGDEYDALGSARHFYRWRPGQRARIKTKFNRRVRRSARAMLIPVKDD